MLRIHPNDRPSGSYSIPADNPFFGSDTDKQEIWAYGLRNPFRNSFDRLLGTFFIGDVGQDSREEIDAQAATRDRRRRKLRLAGARRLRSKIPAYPHDPIPPDAVDPAYDYPHSVGQTVIGGYVYRGKKIKALRGTYVFADYLGPETGDFTGRIFTLNFDGTIGVEFPGYHGRSFPDPGGEFSLCSIRRR